MDTLQNQIDSILLDKIIKIIETTPNDMELGAKIRKIYWEIKKNQEN